MDAIELLKAYKKRLDPLLKKYFDEKIKRAGEIDVLGKQAVKMIADFTLAGGKRIRPALVYYGYLSAGGKDDQNIVETSMSIELIHSFLLIHDDIIDRDEKRHGVATLHERYKKIGLSFVSSKDNDHFGNSMAIVAGDMANAMANGIMFNAKLAPKTIIQALDKLQDIVYVTIPGEMLDVVLGNRGHASEKEVLRMFEGKTSRYTFEGPLHLGCVLAGGDEKMLSALTAYSLPLGKAFQIRDDILGVFGDEKKMGKPVGSDVIEGKQTLLLIKALQKGTSKQKQILKSYLGKKDLTEDELEKFREIIRETGSLDYSRVLAEKFVSEALEAIKGINFKNEEAKFFLEGIARYIIKREA